MFCPVRAVFPGDIFAGNPTRDLRRKKIWNLISPLTQIRGQPAETSQNRTYCQTARGKILKSKQKPILIASSVSSGSDLKRPIASGLFKSIRISSIFSKHIFSGKTFPLKTSELLISLNFKASNFETRFGPNFWNSRIPLWTFRIETFRESRFDLFNRHFSRILFWTFLKQWLNKKD